MNGPADTVLHADNYGHGPAYVGGRCQHCASIADRAVIARIGGRLSVSLFLRMGWNAAAEREATEAIYRTRGAGYGNVRMLPESAFTWPIYVAALGNYADLKRREVEALHRYGERTFGDAWWPGQSHEGYPPEDAALLDEMGYFEDEADNG